MTSSYRVVSTPTFAKCLRELIKKGKKGKDAMMKSRAAQAEAAEAGEITIVQRTKHGETRLPNVEKYDLGDGYRLVVQLIAPAVRQRAFLFVGDHEDADSWLDNHKNYEWVKRDGDSTLEFIQVTDPKQPRLIIPPTDIESPESLLHLPLLRDVSDEEWKQSGLDAQSAEYLKLVTATLWEQDPDGIVSHLETFCKDDHTCFAIDVLEHAHRREWDELHRRFEVAAGSAHKVDGEEAAALMLQVDNCDHFVTWEDSIDVPPESDWADWMLFLHPEQRLLIDKELNGPARLRGVSGSGKTCVMVHRARHLAKKYRKDILLVTLTDTTRRLLEILVKRLCGAEQAHIRLSTMSSLAKDVIAGLAPGGLASFLPANDAQIEKTRRDAVAAIQAHPAFSETVLSKLQSHELYQFVTDEVTFVRMRFLPGEYDKYLKVPRHGRGLALAEKARSIVLTAVEVWDKALGGRVLDHEGIVQRALTILGQSSVAARQSFRFRCVLVDEVQDLSQLEMRILSRIPDSDGKPAAELGDGMFLVGDGAQTIYKRGFSLKHCGINVTNRSYVLTKNYRNTKEILRAAYGLIEKYEFADIDEDNMQRPTSPDLSSRHGEKPFIVKCTSHQTECDFVVASVREILEEHRLKDVASERDTPTEVPICIIGFTNHDRDRIGTALRLANIPVCGLREDVSWTGNAVKISTLESAKGHEFHAVFIVGVCQGTIPHHQVEPGEWKREAARLYVAMTRARDRLYLSYDTAGRYGCSTFLSAIQPDCQECEFKLGKLEASK